MIHGAACTVDRGTNTLSLIASRSLERAPNPPEDRRCRTSPCRRITVSSSLAVDVAAQRRAFGALMRTYRTPG
jgi:hypothetical protein